MHSRPNEVSHFLSPEDPISTPTAAANMHSMTASRMYVFFDARLYSPKMTTPQKVLTNGRACCTVTPHLGMCAGQNMTPQNYIHWTIVLQ